MYATRKRIQGYFKDLVGGGSNREDEKNGEGNNDSETKKRDEGRGESSARHPTINLYEENLNGNPMKRSHDVPSKVIQPNDGPSNGGSPNGGSPNGGSPNGVPSKVIQPNDGPSNGGSPNGGSPNGVPSIAGILNADSPKGDSAMNDSLKSDSLNNSFLNNNRGRDKEQTQLPLPLNKFNQQKKEKYQEESFLKEKYQENLNTQELYNKKLLEEEEERRKKIEEEKNKSTVPIIKHFFDYTLKFMETADRGLGDPNAYLDCSVKNRKKILDYFINNFTVNERDKAKKYMMDNYSVRMVKSFAAFNEKEIETLTYFLLELTLFLKQNEDIKQYEEKKLNEFIESIESTGQKQACWLRFVYKPKPTCEAQSCKAPSCEAPFSLADLFMDQRDEVDKYINNSNIKDKDFIVRWRKNIKKFSPSTQNDKVD